VMKLLEKQPEARVQTAVELAEQLVAIAAQHGWASPSASDPIGRFSMPQLSPAVSARPVVTPPVHDAGPTIPAPTTLTGAASQSHPMLPRSKTPLVLGLGGFLAVAAGIVMFLAVRGGDSSPGEPAPSERTPAARPTPAEIKPAEIKPAEIKPAEAKPAEAKSAEAKPVEPKPVEAKPAETKPVEAKPVETKPVEPKPVEAKPAEAKQPTPRPKPVPRKPTPSKPPKPQKPTRLIETDL